MRPVTLGVLGALAAASVAGAILLMPSTDVSDVRIGERIFPDFAARTGEVRSIELQRPDGTIVIQRDGEEWRVPARAGYPADTARVRQLFVEVTDLRTLEAKTRNKALYAELEVEDRDAPNAKSTRIAFKNAQGQEVLALIAGKNRFGRGGGGDDAVYVRKADDAQAWLAKGRLTVNRDSLQWLDRQVTAVLRERVREAVVTHPDGSKTVVSRPTPAERDFALPEIPEGRKAKSTWEIASVAGAFDRLELDDVKRAADVTLPTAPVATATVDTFDGLQVTAKVYEMDGGFWASFSASASPPAQLPEGGTALKKAEEVQAEAAAINTRTAPWIYKLPPFNADNMRRKVEDLLEPKES
jgi:hypothetical protein